jgi:hypothetical protein
MYFFAKKKIQQVVSCLLIRTPLFVPSLSHHPTHILSLDRFDWAFANVMFSVCGPANSSQLIRELKERNNLLSKFPK